MSDTLAVPAATPRSFRSDINGLRAIAVLAVLAFHFRVPHLDGGFVGVDIFFVISGFLMTGIIVGRLDRGSFSLPGFFLDRARRIIPPLAVLLATGLVIGGVFLLPDEYFVFAKHAAASALFLSNMAYWREGSYFDPDAGTKWLLHTWSLSVEWQFYLLYPLMLLVVVRIVPRSRLWIALAVATAGSIVLMLWLGQTSPRSAFFLLPPRAWEMLAGGLVYLAPPLPAARARVVQLAGLALLAGSIALASDAAWPNGFTIVPVLGTALVILAARRDSRITGNPVARAVGLASYSIYLWHWPFAVLLLRTGHASDWRWIAGAFAASFALGWLSWRVIERRGNRAPAKPHVHVAPVRTRLLPHLVQASLVGVIVIAGGAVWKARGLPQRFSKEVQALQADLVPGNPYSRGCFSIVRDVPQPCIVGPGGDRSRTQALLTVIGDSHADATIGGVVAALSAGSTGGIAFNGYASCAPLLDAQSTDPENKCGAFNARFLPPLTRPRTTPVVLIGFWDGYATESTLRFGNAAKAADADEVGRQIVRTGCAMAKGGPTYMLLPTPHFPMRVATQLQRALASDPNTPDITMPVAEVERRNAPLMPYFRQAESSCGVRLLDPLPLLCPGGRCMGSDGHRAIIRDEHHLTEYGNRRLTPLFRSIIPGR